MYRITPEGPSALRFLRRQGTSIEVQPGRGLILILLDYVKDGQPYTFEDVTLFLNLAEDILVSVESARKAVAALLKAGYIEEV